jgi:hypothetical protein
MRPLPLLLQQQAERPAVPVSVATPSPAARAVPLARESSYLLRSADFAFATKPTAWCTSANESGTRKGLASPKVVRQPRPNFGFV